jgi:hypothetical protein
MKEINDKSFQSHYFIKFTNNKPIDENIKKLKLIKFNFNNTVGPKSISKPELIDEFDSIYRETINIIKLNNKKLEICIDKNVSHKRYMIDILLKNQQIK